MTDVQQTDTMGEVSDSPKKRGRKPGGKVAASRISGGTAPGSKRTVLLQARFPDGDFREIAALARSQATSESDALKQLARKGLAYDKLHDELESLRKEVSKLSLKVSDARGLIVDELRAELSQANWERFAERTAEIMLAKIRSERAQKG